MLAGRQWLADTNDFQNQDPAGPNYLTARTSKPEAWLEAVMVPLVGPHGSQRFPKPTPAFRLVDAPLDPGDTITVTYGDRSGGSAGIGVQAFETDALLLPLYIDLQGNGNWLTPRVAEPDGDRGRCGGRESAGPVGGGGRARPST